MCALLSRVYGGDLALDLSEVGGCWASSAGFWPLAEQGRNTCGLVVSAVEPDCDPLGVTLASVLLGCSRCP